MASAYKVLFVVPDGLSGQGGIGRLALYINQHKEHALDNFVLCIHKTRFVGWPFVKHLSTLWSLIWFVARCCLGRYALVHIHSGPPRSTLRKAAFLKISKWFGLPVVVHLHGSGYNVHYARSSQRVQNIIKRFFHSADKIIVLGDVWFAMIRDVLLVPPQRIVKIANGVPDPKADTALFSSPRWHNSEQTAKDTVHIAMIGVIDKRKGVDVLLHALAALPHNLNWHAVLAGDGRIAEFQGLSERLGLGTRVRFTGWLDTHSVNTLLAASDIFVLPSRAENQPLSILEAMANMKPVIATNLGAIPEQVLDGITGLIVPVGDIPCLSAALKTLIESDKMRTEMGQAGRARFVKYYNIADSVRALMQVYMDVIGPVPKLKKP